MGGGRKRRERNEVASDKGETKGNRYRGKEKMSKKQARKKN